MTTETWRPLGVDTEDDIAQYDALHDGVPAWMHAAYWLWVRQAMTIRKQAYNGYAVDALDVMLAEEMCQILRIPLKDLRVSYMSEENGNRQLNGAIEALKSSPAPLQVADYLVAFADLGEPLVARLEEMLERSKSLWTVGTRGSRAGLVRRVPKGVQVAADAVIAGTGNAGVRLAQAWECLYGLDPRPSEAYRKAIQAVEEAVVPAVPCKRNEPTLGNIIYQMEQDADWTLPMDREHPLALTKDVIVSMMRVLWRGQDDRHGGQPATPTDLDVSFDEARVAIGIAVPIVDWFSAGLVKRRP